MKIRSKLKILIAFYSFFPVLSISVTLWGAPMFFHQDFQKALVIGISMAILMTLFGHLAGMPWLLMRQMKSVMHHCQEIRNGNYSWVNLPNEPTDPSDENEMNALMRHMNWMANQIHLREQSLKNALDAIERNNLELKAANEEIEEARKALWGEMALAKKIQTSLLPSTKELPGFLIDAMMIPADEVGGDYYDIISINDHHWVVIGDVSGHGVPAGLIMMMVQTAIQTVLSESPGISPDRLLSVVNLALTRNIRRLNESKYMTIMALHVQPDGNIDFAGLHQDLLIYRHRSETIEVVETGGMWLGFIEDISDLSDVRRCSLEPEDCLLLYTDGVTESRKGDGRMLGDAGLIDLLLKTGAKAPEDICRFITAHLEDYEKGDDMTLLALKRIGVNPINRIEPVDCI